MTPGASARVRAAADALAPRPPRTPASGLAQAGPQAAPALHSACREMALHSARVDTTTERQTAEFRLLVATYPLGLPAVAVPVRMRGR
jgi:hypothetical protein